MRLAITGDRNRPGKADWSGAFRPEARRYAAWRPSLPEGAIAVVPLDAPRRDQRDAIARAIRTHQPHEVAFFCHGYASRLELGYDIATALGLAEALADAGCSRVALYACSTASDPVRGFASRLRDAMVLAGIEAPVVVGHATAGHTSRNPKKRRFLAPAGSPGEWIVAPGSPGWREWARRLRTADDPLRWQVLDYGREAAAVA